MSPNWRLDNAERSREPRDRQHKQDGQAGDFDPAERRGVRANQPMPRATPMTGVVAIRLRSMLATTWPTRTEAALTGMLRNRSIIPLVMSVATDTAVVPAPKPAHRTISPGTT